ncbi:MAG: recombinase family protein [Alphaproteobacteria bacterium]|nr:recombinase family protein [Alphaproteobacteria bacterium]
MSEAQARKIAPHHLEREACLYVRQSSLRQVMRNTESKRRQYGLSRKAVGLGWPPERIRVIDEDQGKSGAHSENRSGFRDLMARIGAGEVGIVMSLEVSRLARDNADWHQLLRLAGIANTLILDENGIYDANDGNDRMLMGIKGTISEFELRGIRARLIGGQRNAAARGALKMRLPVGLAYNDKDEVVFDPDRSVVDAIALVFERFRRLGSAKAVAKWMHRENIELPARPRSGPAHGELRWSLPRTSQVNGIVRNPRYAGAYVYGRRRSERRADGTERRRFVPMKNWRACIQDAHVGFIDWEEYLRNQATLKGNRAAFLESGRRRAPLREGAALLQSRVICGRCGRRMSMQYNRALPRRNRPARYFYVCKEEQLRYGRKTCQRMRGDLVDAEISRFAIGAMNRSNIDLALAVQEQVEAEFAEADAQRAGRIEGLSYEADLARRRFYAVDPANRLVAASLEADWNERLRELEEARREREDRAAARDAELSERQAERVRELARDFEQVWNARGTGNADRKRLLGHLIEDATLTRDGFEVRIDLRMRGGSCLTLEPVRVPKPIARIRKTPAKTVAAVDRLLESHGDEGTARELNRMGRRTWQGKPYTDKGVGRIRRAYGLPNHIERQMKPLREKGFGSAREVAAQLGMNERVVRRLGKAGDARVERVMVPIESRRRYCMYRAKPAALPAPSSGD